MRFSRRQFAQILLGSATMVALGHGGAFSQDEKKAQSGHGHSMGMTTDPAGKIQVAILFYPMAVLFDYGPAEEIFRVTEGFTAFNVYSVGTEPNPIPAMFPKQIHADYSLANAPKPAVVVIPGGDWAAMKERRDVAGWLQSVLDDGGILLAVCSGGYVLAAWGFLDGLPVTGVHVQLALLRKLAPKAKVIEEAPFIDAGQIVTTAGAATSLDAALHVVKRLKGPEAARWVAEVYLDHHAWDRDFDGDPARFTKD